MEEREGERVMDKKIEGRNDGPWKDKWMGGEMDGRMKRRKKNVREDRKRNGGMVE